MTLKDILEYGYGIIFESLDFKIELEEGENEKERKEEILKSIENNILYIDDTEIFVEDFDIIDHEEATIFYED